MPEKKRIRVQRRSRFDIKYFWPSGASLRWESVPTRALSQLEMVKRLREIADTIEEHGGPTRPKVTSTPSPGDDA
jgi:hypothetical protein